MNKKEIKSNSKLKKLSRKEQMLIVGGNEAIGGEEGNGTTNGGGTNNGGGTGNIVCLDTLIFCYELPEGCPCIDPPVGD
ncbi:hypothetical protein MUU74_17970 [Chryseobacterium daecheongense]|uniref:hypothetical protein n=1 Tax=Chryseobacterium daecheongense TaxID=192389 RepID=UPI001FD708B1|nr:hypothetical protein [Chryseobacterium daecheongense]UOU98365.1 hypothetical protein MUU74_17970 [Chryseobacterium daecheongense]